MTHTAEIAQPAAAAAGRYAGFAPLDDPASLERQRLPSVCIVTGELVGPFKNGGIGTSMTGLAELLSAYGAPVTVLYTGATKGVRLAEWQARFRAAGVTLEDIAELPARRQAGPLADIGWTNAWTIYETLRQRAFDVVHFNDTGGEGVFCLVAKRLGLAFEKTLLSLAVHSPTEWILEANGHEPTWLGFTCSQTAERISLAAADLVWAPSRYILDWLAGRGCRLPRQVFNQQYVIPTPDLFAAGRDKCVAAATPVAPRAPRKPSEIVFFGRLEERKGVRLFAAAITRLADALARRRIAVLFMGKIGLIDGVPADRWLAARAAAWPFAWRIESGFGQREALDHLTRGDSLAVMASPIDNSPCTVYEALQFGIPFIAAATGGTGELVHPADRATHLFDYRVEALAARLRDILEHGIGIARPAIAVAETQARWLGMHVGWRALLPPPPAAQRARRYAVVIDDNASAGGLAVTWAAVEREFAGVIAAAALVRRASAPPVRLATAAELRLIDELDDATPLEVFAGFREKGADAVLVIRAGADLARGAAGLFDQSLAAAIDGVVPFAEIAGTDVFPTLGGSAAMSFLKGEFEVGGALFDLDAIEDRLGPDLACLDRNRLYFGLVEEMQARDATIWPLPAAVFRWPDMPSAIVELPGPAARCRAYAAAPIRELYQMLAMARAGYRTPAAAAPRRPLVVRAARRIVKALAGEAGVRTVRAFLRSRRR